MNHTIHPRSVRGFAALIVLVTMLMAFGIPGALAAGLTIAVLATLPPMYGFAVGQLAIAILIATTSVDLHSPAVLGAHFGLLLALWSDLAAPQNRDLVPIVVASTGLLGAVAVGVIWETESLWQTGGVLIVTIVFLVYGIHRYTIVFVLEEAPP